MSCKNGNRPTLFKSMKPQQSEQLSFTKHFNESNGHQNYTMDLEKKAKGFSELRPPNCKLVFKYLHL